MPKFVTLVRFGDDVLEDFENHRDAVDAARDVIREAGGELEAYYVTLGQYDGIAVTEVPDAETSAALSVSIGRGDGTLETETLRAFDEEEVGEIIDRLPG